MKSCLVIALLLLPLAAQAQHWQSRPQQTDVIELYTSEGCSSCPPAERWLSSLKEQPGLFSDFIPLAFHVDYWDSLGWPDRLASHTYSERQRRYVHEGQVSQVYTPGFVINSQEWRPWFRGVRNWTPSERKPGVLSANLDGRALTVDYADEQASELHVAYLGMGLTSDIKAGENRGRTLSHDFVVLRVMEQVGRGHWQMALPPIPQKGQNRTALAVWVSPTDRQNILQAVGGYLE
ncbi:MAG: DUF1223 domain-containing protein [Marinobacter sp.]|nr:DUF1223 domain-containing protein [Marinobacter sp.]